MRIDVLALFPELVAAVGQLGIPRRAQEAGALALTTRQIRDFTPHRGRRVDDRPFGGGPGMVMQAEPVSRAIDAAKTEMPGANVLMMSPQGERLSQRWLEKLAGVDQLIVVCGRYEGIDERVSSRIDLELSIGDYVLSGGELAAMVVIDGIARLLPGVLGDSESAAQDSFSAGLLDHPQYSRPEVWQGEPVPEILMCGDHAKVARWRMQQALGRTWLRRPELLEDLQLSEEQTRLLREFIAGVNGEPRQT